VRRSILVVTGEVLAAELARPAIRAWRIAQALGAHHDVTLATTNERTPDFRAVGFRALHATPEELGSLARRSEVVIVQGDALRRAPEVRDSGAVLVVDLYDPFQLEQLEQSRGLDVLARRRAVGVALDVVNEQLRRGDAFLCASERQRDFWLGHLAAVGRLNERVYDTDPGLARFVLVVPFGTDPEVPVRRGAGLRGAVPGIGADDEILLWGGGIYDWFDPASLIRAVDALRATRPRIRLVFAGARHPNADVGVTAASRHARALAAELGLLDTHVFFGDWVPYDERAAYLLDADIGVSTHLDHIETAFSFRTRVLDYLWAGLPSVLTRGDALADAVERAGAGVAVAPEDAHAIAAAIDALLNDPHRRAAAGAAAADLGASYRWDSVLAPLVELCETPARSPDLVDRPLARAIAQGRDLQPTGWRSSVLAVADLVRAGEWRTLGAKVAARVRRRS
jgi:glycosyltransferase involved in cell wall biosynthesis